ncbi:MAG: hypothetical protein H6835_16015 [Planctomycetes bacterium]|nr:hypothetical protein [Planctomycetota bacterium]
MGYDLHITRSMDWADNRGHEISIEEWLAVVRQDSELDPDPANGPYSVRFGRGARWFDWSDGNVFTTDPDHASVAKMLDLAQLLVATVQGDDGEFYESPNEWSRARRTR